MAMPKSKNIDMLNGSLYKSIMAYTLPVMLSSILQLMFNAADLIVVGRYCGHLSVGAVGSTGSITMLIINTFVGLSIGVSVTVAVAIGAQDEERCSRAVHTAIPLAIIGGAVLSVIGIVGAKFFLGLMDTPEDVIDLSALYMRVFFAGIIGNLLYNYGSAILRAMGDTKRPLIYLAVAGVLNVILNLFFVIAFKMDVAGVALATIISQAISACFVLRALMNEEGMCHLDFKKMHIYPAQLKQIVKVGLPAGFQGILFSITNVTIQKSVNGFGSIAVSGNSAAANVENFTYMSMNAFSQAALNFSGQNLGAQKFSRLRQICKICVIYAIGVGFIMGTLTYLNGEALLNIYIPDSPESIKVGMIRFGFLALPYWICGCMDTLNAFIRGLGKSLPPMIITVLNVCGGRMIWIYTIFRIPKYHTLQMLYITYPVTWIMCIVMLLAYFHHVTKDYPKEDKVSLRQA